VAYQVAAGQSIRCLLLSQGKGINAFGQWAMGGNAAAKVIQPQIKLC